MIRRKLMLAATGAVLAAPLLGAPTPAVAQAWPTRPITVIVPFAAGGPTDVMARVLSQKMGETLGQ